MKTNIGKLFLRLINKNFLPTHKYRKIFNRNTIKVSYSCMSNIKSKISTHNRKMLNKPVNQITGKFNCIKKNTYPLKGHCLLKTSCIYRQQSLTKRITSPKIIKELVKTHLENDTETIKDHSTLIYIKTIRNYPSSTGI